ncbi:murein transglycosylase A [Sulfurimonas sp.]|uniref:murein transglycosylase A n=1 Tax=Sulfurimonas sp. TaxID=2022749 RepID=UPI0026101DCA|nr:murein transglycosylase A [Sulfurimonas sp.]
MKSNVIILVLSLLILGCSKQVETPLPKLRNTYVVPAAFSELPALQKNNFQHVLDDFINNCRITKAQKIYGSLCQEAKNISNAKEFLLNNFEVYRVYKKNGVNEGLLTGYYEPELQGSLTKSSVYKYPLYCTPKDLVSVDLSAIYPELKHYRLRGRLEGNRVVPYDSRAEIKRSDINSSVICYCKSKIDRFFLEVQGSGKVILDNNKTIYVGYANQNGYKYSSIGKYLIKNGDISANNISLQSIRAWLEAHPKKIDTVLNQNKKMIFFAKRSQGATGALGLQLRAKSSVAVDSQYISLGSMLYLSSNFKNRKIDKFVFAQDVGGAIKGPLRVDYFLGSGEAAMQTAGKLKAPLKMWIILPKEERFMNE